MAFSISVVDAAWRRSGGRCECRRTTHGHSVPHGAVLVAVNRGRDGIGAWETNHRTRVESGGDDSLSNCEILCWTCHRATF